MGSIEAGDFDEEGARVLRQENSDEEYKIAADESVCGTLRLFPVRLRSHADQIG